MSDTSDCPPELLAEELQQELLKFARVAQGQAYVPYSKFPVGAAVLDEHGKIHTGCNVENASYPLGTCAESGALSAMVLAGGRQVRAVLVVGDGEALVTPCGGCRQKLREFAAADLPVLVADRQHIRHWFTMGELLPSSFGPDNLAMTREPNGPAG
ncbi:cytidine deaminase [Ensifer adhaerens]|uniref:cytidine deaminase n=1 Tax=Ensifer adhaerens TaxID=106592 RepID=UPI001CC0F237|nr:cytidine deaminase [Ensifer adhaerens]MBZ7924909.1 cytidine deaminase [Ensifer adhaerens]UAX95877.1 cytidine deaminase [Ensifer adhaerens]UAY04781.1 cytidine deaminase [Ensifer adhaerens]UAY10212.1 cytidine deaminase [Ensifer adhaerens]